jgi:polysaccharide deacetylase family protein (PEP-CTERM system associated)
LPSSPSDRPVEPGDRYEPPFAMSVDVEDYFQVQAFARTIPRSEWGRYPSRVEGNTRRLLDLFDEKGARATFFVLGCVARDHARLVAEIASRGHEVASHGMSHRMLTELTPSEFLSELDESRGVLEDAAQRRVVGFRAPSYSVNEDTLWALDVLADAGYEYDSSIYPIRRSRYGYPGGPTRPVRLDAGHRGIAEFPMASLPFGPVRLPVLAGA